MFNTLNLSQYLHSQMNNSMNPQNFTQPLTSSQLPRHDAQEMIQSVINQPEEEMNIEKLDQNNSGDLDGMVKRESYACIPAQQTIKQEFKRESPHVKISVYKQHQLASQKFYILQDDKIIGGNQVHKNEIQIIRRKKAEDNNLDFGLSGQESNVELIPCKILTKYGFLYSSRITSEILVLLSLKYLPQGQSLHSKIAKLPSNVFRLIHQFIKVKPKFFVQDCGTSLKTLVRIQKDKPKRMQLNNKYLIGSDLYFNVVQLISNPKSTHKQNLETDNDYFFQTLVREHARDRSRIHGLTKEEQEMFQCIDI
ncbi:unnamed protein product (macronuclear) [Paramecium tetraurelia]|uniref:Uncharacterized protein n=1 Tax=Paramecium tetraurelia TaxID=5888 RepID=A0D3J9_PARTE|nr:uncharacterized protein GSPATT00013104001 [Paramecium tetraurelia]CAK77616.1 unnamed protein product [Paramecium tetraurelia]|eukprot:XP_001445013.1 hypothetical protein (macronuclear) [Paramecium tetraurelia strain d4-2]